MCIAMKTYEKVSVSQTCLILYDRLDCSPPGSSVHGILQARILEWVAISFSRGSSWPGIEPRSPALQEDPLQTEPPGTPRYFTEDQYLTHFYWCIVFCVIQHSSFVHCWWKFELLPVFNFCYKHAFICFLVYMSEKAMAPHSSTLAWKIPWMEEPGRLQSMGSLRVGHDWATSLSLFNFMHWRRQWQPTPVFLPGESQGWASLVGCCLWGRTESDMTEVT